ncbi:hypothetical protein GCM10027091_09930 [Streptomyces daliensis]
MVIFVALGALTNGTQRAILGTRRHTDPGSEVDPGWIRGMDRARSGKCCGKQNPTRRSEAAGAEAAQKNNKGNGPPGGAIATRPEAGTGA